MANILQWLFWCTSAAVGSFASADFLLLDRQKKWISDRAEHFWLWLEDQNELKYIAYLRKFKWQRFVVILYATVALVGVIMAAVMELANISTAHLSKTLPKALPKEVLEDL